MKRKLDAANVAVRSSAALHLPEHFERARIALHEATDGRAFRRAVGRLVLAAVRADSVSVTEWTQGAPQHQDLTLRRPRRRDGPAAAAAPIHRDGLQALLSAHAAAHPGANVIATPAHVPRHRVTDDPLSQRERLPAGSPGSAAALLFWTGGSPPVLEWAAVLWRGCADAGFSREELRRLGALHGEVRRVSERVKQLEEQAMTRRELERFVRDLPVGVAILNWDLVPLYYNRRAVDCAARWRDAHGTKLLKGDGPNLDLPAELLSQCVAAGNRWRAEPSRNGRTTRPDAFEVESGQNPGLRATIRVVTPEPGRHNRPVFRIAFDEPVNVSPKASAAARRLTMLAKLSRCEREVVQLVLQGLSNGEIATSLGRSLGTVKTTLHTVFGKLAVASRAQLLARLR